MRTSSSPFALRVFLLSTLGVLGCTSGSSSSENAPHSSGGTGGSSGGSGGTADNSGGNAGASSSGCTNPVPIMEGHDTGIFYCEEGYLHRAEARECPTQLPRDRTIEWPASAEGGAGGAGGATYTTGTDDCQRDQDCGDPLQRCEVVRTNGYGNNNPCIQGLPVEEAPNYARLCVSGCRVDADCTDGELCICGDPVGHCASKWDCRSDADCQDGALCLNNARNTGFDSMSFACQTPDDTCQSDADCEGYPDYCLMSATGRSCRPDGVVCGRPFLVDSVARVAAARCTDTWLEKPRAAINPAISKELAATIAVRWTEVGLMEHASVAAFARFTLQLLAMGAPAELIEASNRAQADETRHARMAFDIATRYAQAPVGPGPLSLDGTIVDSNWENILKTTIEEGCIGETCAAIEASHAAELCEDPDTAEALRTIAQDEAQHAALAWRTVHWMLDRRPHLRPLAERAFRQTAEAAPPATSLRLSILGEPERYGVLEELTRAACRSSALRDVIAPCAQGLLEPTRRTMMPREAALNVGPLTT